MSDSLPPSSNLTHTAPSPPLLHHSGILRNNTTSAKYLSNSASNLLPPPYRPSGPDRAYPPNWLSYIQMIVAVQIPTPGIPAIRFDISSDAAQHNALLIKEHGNDIEALIRANPNTTMSHGSEFRPTPTLHMILHIHPLWTYVRGILEKGADFIFKTEPDDTSRLTENTDLLQYNNHKSAQSMPDVITSSLQSEVDYGFAFVIPNSAVNTINHAMVVPLGIAIQHSIREDGSRKEKHRLTHDQTYEHNDHATSSNNAIDESHLPDLIYGHCFHRILHHIASLRLRYPGQVIFISKFDFSKAYRRASHSGRSAARCTSTHDGMAYIQLRLSFGGKGCPPAWCAISEITTDLANDLLLCEAWQPSVIRSPVQPLVPAEKRLSTNVPFAPALSLALEPPAHPEGKADCYVDDVITIFLDTPENCVRAPAAVPLAIHIMNRPLADDEPIQRTMFLAQDKLQAEGGPREQAIVLGWLICTRSFTVSLPPDKFLAWTMDANDILSHGGSSFKAFESFIGRLEHAATIIPHSCYFMNRLRNLKKNRRHYQVVKLTTTTTADLHLWIRFLTRARDGININLLTTRQPTHILFSDSFPGGLGGYSITSGKAWQLELDPSEFDATVSNNLLEYIAAVVQVWLTVQFDADCPALSCILAWTDSSSGASWLHKSNFDDITDPLHDTVARKYATLLLDASCLLFPQHIQGARNNIADDLSRRFDLPSPQLEAHLRLSYPEQMPLNFHIVPLPKEISSWVFSIVAPRTESSTPRPKHRTRNTIVPGDVGSSSSTTPSACKPTPTLTTSPSTSGSTSAPASSNASKPDTFPTPNNAASWTENIQSRYLAGLSKKPLGIWLRNSGVLGGKAPFTTRKMETALSPKSNNSS